MVYFSATGNTEKAATYIAEITGGDLFELEPAQPYTDEDLNYGNDDSRVSREHEDESLRGCGAGGRYGGQLGQLRHRIHRVSHLVGYCRMAVYSFFDEYDFSGKTIIPFNVHNGSRFSRTIQTIKELEPNATMVEDGFTESEQTVDGAAGDVADWLDELGY